MTLPKKPGSHLLYFSANPNGEAELVTVVLRNTGQVKKLKWELDFADLKLKDVALKEILFLNTTYSKLSSKKKVSTLNHVEFAPMKPF